MENYKDRLDSFATRIKEEKVELPIQKVEPTNFVTEAEVQLNVYIPKSMMKKLKSKCIERDLKIKQFIVLAIEHEIGQNWTF